MMQSIHDTCIHYHSSYFMLDTERNASSYSTPPRSTPPRSTQPRTGRAGSEDPLSPGVQGRICNRRTHERILQHTELLRRMSISCHLSQFSNEIQLQSFIHNELLINGTEVLLPTELYDMCFDRCNRVIASENCEFCRAKLISMPTNDFTEHLDDMTVTLPQFCYALSKDKTKMKFNRIINTEQGSFLQSMIFKGNIDFRCNAIQYETWKKRVIKEFEENLNKDLNLIFVIRINDPRIESTRQDFHLKIKLPCVVSLAALFVMDMVMDVRSRSLMDKSFGDLFQLTGLRGLPQTTKNSYHFNVSLRKVQLEKGILQLYLDPENIDYLSRIVVGFVEDKLTQKILRKLAKARTLESAAIKTMGFQYSFT